MTAPGGGRTEFRVVWKRRGLSAKRREFKRQAAAEKFLLLLGPEPWRAYLKGDDGADDRVCCSGYMCGCGGMTYREQAEDRRKDMPPVEYVRVQERRCTEWRPADPGKEGKDGSTTK